MPRELVLIHWGGVVLPFLRQRGISGAFLFVLAKKKCPRTPKEKSAFAGAVEPYVGGSGDVVIPKQDTLLCIADRSLSRLRGSPLPGAGCLCPGSCVGMFIRLGAVV